METTYPPGVVRLNHPSQGTEVLMLSGPDGADFIRVCREHRWASLPSVTVGGVPIGCPLCLATDDMAPGQRRYDELQRRLMPEGAR